MKVIVELVTGFHYHLKGFTVLSFRESWNGHSFVAGGRSCKWNPCLLLC